MKKYILIGIGGILGAVTRYLVKEVHIYNYSGEFPLNTLIINVSGSFVLALILTVAFEVWKFDEDVRLGIATGFLGAYTTFSTLCKETVGLLKDGFYFPAVSYIVASTVLGLAAVYSGMVVARKVVSGIVKRGKEELEENVPGEIEGDAE